jgi:hypothetical protein
VIFQPPTPIVAQYKPPHYSSSSSEKEQIMNRINYSRNDLGQTTVHYAGTTLLVATLIALVMANTTTDIGQQIVCTINSAISQVSGGSPISCGTETTDSSKKVEPAKANRDAKEPDSCTASAETASGAASVTIGFVKLGQSFTLVKQEKKYIDPETGEVETHYSVVATDGGQFGTEAGIGTKGEVNNSGLGADVSAEVSLTVKKGDTWEFDSEADMDAFLKQLSDYRTQQSELRNMQTGFYAMYLTSSGKWVNAPRNSDKSSLSVDISGKVGMDGGLRVGNDEDGKKSVNLNSNIYIKTQVGQNYTHQKDNRKGHEGEYTDTISYSGSIGGGVNAVFWGVSGTGNYEGGMSSTYDKNGNMTEISFTQKTSGDLTWNTTNGPVKGNGDITGSVTGSLADKQTHVTTTRLKVTDENRTIVNGWLSQAYATDPHSGATTLMLPPNMLNPDSPVSGDPMQQLLYEQAISTDSIYNVDGNDISIGGEVAAGLKLGAQMNIGNEDSKIAQQTYLGSTPSSGAGRPRKVVDWCTK